MILDGEQVVEGVSKSFVKYPGEENSAWLLRLSHLHCQNQVRLALCFWPRDSILCSGHHQDSRPDLLQQHHRALPLQQQDQDYRGTWVCSKHTTALSTEQQDIKNNWIGETEEVEEAVSDKEQGAGLGGLDGEQRIGGEDNFMKMQFSNDYQGNTPGQTTSQAWRAFCVGSKELSVTFLLSSDSEYFSQQYSWSLWYV